MWSDNRAAYKHPSAIIKVFRCKTHVSPNATDLSRCPGGHEGEHVKVTEGSWTPDGVDAGGTGHYFMKGTFDLDFGTFVYEVRVEPMIDKVQSPPLANVRILGKQVVARKIVRVRNVANVRNGV
jgi:hypothetical protein